MNAANELTDAPQVVVAAQVDACVIAVYPRKALVPAALIAAQHLRSLRNAGRAGVTHERVHCWGPRTRGAENLVAHPSSSGGAANESLALGHPLECRRGLGRRSPGATAVPLRRSRRPEDPRRVAARDSEGFVAMTEAR